MENHAEDTNFRISRSERAVSGGGGEERQKHPLNPFASAFFPSALNWSGENSSANSLNAPNCMEMRFVLSWQHLLIENVICLTV